jgi:HEPN domain-containing protein
MATRQQLRDLAQLRLREAESLFDLGLYDGCAYLCGYVVELALEARICATLGVEEYPEKGSRLKDAFLTHDFDDLKLLAGMENEFTPDRLVLFKNWSVASRWNPKWRYVPEGTYNQATAEAILNAIRMRPDGVLECISSHW